MLITPSAIRLDFIRHGLAVDRQPDQEDEGRPLTPRGQTKTLAIAHQLQARNIHWPLLLTSPLRRAVETAAIFQDVGLAAEVIVWPPLAPGGEVNQLRQWFVTRPTLTQLALVGHQPDLSEWLEVLLWGQATGAIALKKAGLARIICPPALPPGQGQLQALLTPRFLLGP